MTSSSAVGASYRSKPSVSRRGRFWFLFPFALLAAAYFYYNPFSSNDLNNWMDRSIARDFKAYESCGISKNLLETTWQACSRNKEFLRYQIINSKVYGPESKIRNFLEELIRRYRVPNVDFIYYNEDRLKRSFFKRKEHRKSAPIFVSAKNREIKQAVLFSDWNYDPLDTLNGWNFLIQKINEEYSKSNWSQKIEKLFWRGTPWDGKHFESYTFENWTTIPRGRLVSYSVQFPEWVDAAFSQYPTHCAQQDLPRCQREMGNFQYTPWEQVLRYKYQMIIDGVTCSFPATQWKLLSGCLSFKQDSEDIQYYYDELIPWQHYIPVKRDLSDLKSKILWAKTHDAKSREIAKNAREFALTHLMPEHIFFYCYKVICKYASLQKFQPSTIDP